METIANRLKEAMEEQNLKAVDVATATGISKSAISLYLSGKRTNLSGDILHKLSKYLGKSEAWLLGYEVEPDRESYYINQDARELAEELKARPEMRILFDATRNTSKEDIEFILTMLEKMKG